MFFLTRIWTTVWTAYYNMLLPFYCSGSSISHYLTSVMLDKLDDMIIYFVPKLLGLLLAVVTDYKVRVFLVSSSKFTRGPSRYKSV